MKKDDLNDFTKLWNAAAESYGKSVSDAALVIAFNALRKFEFDDIRRAVSLHLTDTDAGRWMPKPADIVRKIQGDPESRALLAWSKVETALRSTGPYRSVIFDEPEIMAALDEMGGWIKFCEVTDKELPFRRNEFVTRYRGYMTRPPTQWPAVLTGLEEASVARLGFPLASVQPALIGDPQRAIAVRDGSPGKRQKVTMIGDAIKQLGYDHD